jgi:single-strand DNA-binding protein
MIQVSAVGRVITDIRTREFNNGGKVVDCLLSVGSQKKENVLQLKAFGKTAEIMIDRVSKGSIIAIFGTVQRDEFTDKSGQKRQSVYLIANMIQGPLAFVKNESKTAPKEQRQVTNQQAPQGQGGQGNMLDKNYDPRPNGAYATDDIPF